MMSVETKQTSLLDGQPQDPQQFLTFLLEKQEYGVELLNIQEIRGFSPITPIPNVPNHVRGVMNLRGTVLPVIDLRMKFRLPEVEYTKFTVIVIITVAGKMVGLLVDAVSDVLMISPQDIRPAPDFGSSVDMRFVSGVFETHDHLAVALNLEQLLTEGELSSAPTIN